MFSFVTDKWIEPSIKDCERINRSGSCTTTFSVKGPAQKRPTNWIAALRSNTFKESLIEFLVNQWTDNEYVTTLGDKILYVNVKGEVNQKLKIPVYVYIHEITAK